MNEMWALLVDQLKKQGLSLLLLVFAVWFFFDQNAELQKRVDACNVELKNTLVLIVQNNTEAMNRISDK